MRERDGVRIQKSSLPVTFGGGNLLEKMDAHDLTAAATT